LQRHAAILVDRCEAMTSPRRGSRT
jgi:hypothetical protein